MSFKEHMQSRELNETKTPKQENDSTKSIQFKIAELINNISKFDGEQPDKITRSSYDTFINKSNDLVRVIEESMRREMSHHQEDNKSTMLRFQKVLGEQKKKLKGYMARRWHFAEEEKRNYEDEDVNESAQLLDNDIEFGKLETYEDFVQDRNMRITKIHKDMRIANQIYKDMAIMVQEQSEDIVVIHDNTEATDDKLKKANKELLKVKYIKGINRGRYVRLLFFLVIALFCTMYLVHHWSMEARIDVTQK